VAKKAVAENTTQTTPTADTDAAPARKVARKAVKNTAEKPTTPVKKTARKATSRPAVKKTAEKTAAKTTVKKTATKSPAKTTVKKTAAKSPAKKAAPAVERERNEHGYVVGTDMALISDMLVAGGETRGEVTDRIRGSIEPTTRGGQPKNVSSLVSMAIKELTARGYTQEATWRFIPPVASSDSGRKSTAAPAAKKTARRATGRAKAKG
jgi:hypothetical protein